MAEFGYSSGSFDHREVSALLVRLRAAKAVLAEREQELLELKGPCSGGQTNLGRCRLHYAHSGPCDIKTKESDRG